MTEFRYGPVELYLVGFDGDRPSPDTISALADLLEGGLVRLLDFVIVSKSESGDVEVIEIEDQTEEYGFGSIELAEIGITGEEDIAELVELVEPGSSAAIVALELLYARRLADRLAASGGVVLSAERIPAPIVNAIMDLAEQA
ncbi:MULTISPECIES: DUF6325 family protein [Microbacterium]|uniref:DUF6325 family protein n=1 Tax=Microbacterium schleiferi TaxID=69362 RepID=A0ABU7VA07_9MICO|nr:DUF6325 family protein [Microbacterium sp. 67-17]OJW02346.1 MAG: hypothetical protein BGO47_11550 [Microbacterium sp. 67-17]